MFEMTMTKEQMDLAIESLLKDGLIKIVGYDDKTKEPIYDVVDRNVLPEDIV